MTVTIHQAAFRIRTDANAANGGAPTWAAGQGNNAPVPSNTPFRIRFAISNTGTTVAPKQSYSLNVAKNGGSYAAVGSTPDVVCTDATNGISANGSAIGASLLSASGTYSNSGTYNSTVSSPSANLGVTAYIEMEWGLQFVSPTADGNTYTFQITPANAVDTYPTFTMTNSATLTATEANDTLVAAGSVPRAARLSIIEVGDQLIGAGILNLLTGALNATEANDVLTGVALSRATAALATTEAPDALAASAFTPLVGQAVGNLSQTEANDVLLAAGAVTGVVGSMIFFEANDTLAGRALAAALANLNLVEANDSLQTETLQGLNQWIQAPPCDGDWIEVFPDTGLPISPDVPPPFVA